MERAIDTDERSCGGVGATRAGRIKPCGVAKNGSE